MLELFTFKETVYAISGGSPIHKNSPFKNLNKISIYVRLAINYFQSWGFFDLRIYTAEKSKKIVRNKHSRYKNLPHCESIKI